MESESHGVACKCLQCIPRERKKKAKSVAGRELMFPTAALQVAEADIIDADEDVDQEYPRRKISCKERVAEYLVLRAQDSEISIKEAAEKIGISQYTLGKHIRKATQEGWLRFSDPFERLEYQIIPKVLDNLTKYLEAGDKTVTLEAAKGTIFKTYQESKGVTSHPTTILALRIETVNPDQSKPVSGSIVGVPKQLVIEGEIKDE